MFYGLINRVLADEFIGSTGSKGIVDPLKGKFDDLGSLLIFIGEKLYFLSIPILTIMILYGAFQILTAAGDEKKFETGKRTVLYAIIGFVVVLIAGGIPSLIESFK